MKTTGRSLIPEQLLRLNAKLIIAFLFFGVVPSLVLGWYAYNTSATQLQDAAAHRLEDAAVTDGDTIDRNLFERYGDVQAFAANPSATSAVSENRQGIVDFFTKNYGIYDLMVITNLHGEITTANLVDGNGDPLDSSALIGLDVSQEDWFRTVVDGNTPPGGTYYTDAHFSDLVATAYGEDRLTLPFTAPIYGESGLPVGVWHNEASFERIVSQLFEARREAFAQQGLTQIETQVLRSDGIVLDDAGHDTVMTTNLVTAGLGAAAAATGEPGDEGAITERDPITGIEQINGYAVSDGALGFDGYGWGILVRQATAEASAPANSLLQSLLLFSAGLFLIVIIAGALLARSLSGPLKRNAAKLDLVSDGDLRVRFDAKGRDEVSLMGSALNQALGSISDTMHQVDVSVEDLSESAGQLRMVSVDMSGAAASTSDQATEVAATAEQISASSDSVARAMEQMTASVREISDSTANAARMTSQAVEVSVVTRDRMAKLEASATDIGNVVNVITSIAEQTDLLALNATIEAARVGEAGKGFAVVANEVKALASQTASATGEIQRKVETIQSDALGALEAIGEISDLIEQVNESSTTIAGAVEEQSATSSEVANSIQAVTEGTTNISASIAAVAQAANTTRSGASRALDSSDHLSTLAVALTELLTRFDLHRDDPVAPKRIGAGGGPAEVGPSSSLAALTADTAATAAATATGQTATTPRPAPTAAEPVAAPSDDAVWHAAPIGALTEAPSGRLEDLEDELLDAGWR